MGVSGERILHGVWALQVWGKAERKELEWKRWCLRKFRRGLLESEKHNFYFLGSTISDEKAATVMDEVYSQVLGEGRHEEETDILFTKVSMNYEGWKRNRDQDQQDDSSQQGSWG